MHTFTDTEYLPVLAEGYQFRALPRDDGYSGLALAVIRTPRVANRAVYTYNISIDETKIFDKESLKNVILMSAKRIARMPREWNLEFSKNLREVMAELTPPKDDKHPNEITFHGQFL